MFISVASLRSGTTRRCPCPPAPSTELHAALVLSRFPLGDAEGEAESPAHPCQWGRGGPRGPGWGRAFIGDLERAFSVGNCPRGARRKEQGGAENRAGRTCTRKSCFLSLFSFSFLTIVFFVLSGWDGPAATCPHAVWARGPNFLL